MVCAMISLMILITSNSNAALAAGRDSRKAAHSFNGMRATRTLVTHTMP